MDYPSENRQSTKLLTDHSPLPEDQLDNGMLRHTFCVEFDVGILFLVMVNFVDFYFLLFAVTALLASPRLQAKGWQ